MAAANSSSPPQASYFKHNLPSGVAYHKWTIPNARAILILQHGFAEYSLRYMDGKLPLGPRLQALGFDIWAMDMWGHGDSPGARSVVHIEKAVQDHVALRRQVVAESSSSSSSNNLPIFLMGHSLGGLVTSGSVTSDPTGIAGVILSSPELTQPVSGVERAIVGLGAKFWPSGPVPIPAKPPTGLSRIPAEVKLFEDDERNYHGAIGLLLAATSLDCGAKIWRGAKAWEVPTLVFHGNADQFTKFEVSEEFVGKISSSDKQFYAVEGGYHELMRDLDAEKVMDLVVGWLRERSASVNRR